MLKKGCKEGGFLFIYQLVASDAQSTVPTPVVHRLDYAIDFKVLYPETVFSTVGLRIILEL
jgi:hypothetical protein